MLYQNQCYKEELKYISNIDINWNKLVDCSILVTGISGMIGSELTDALLYKNKYSGSNITIYGMGRNKEKFAKRFLGYDNKYLHFIEHDVNEPLEYDFKPDYIFHCASNTHPNAYVKDPVGTITTNILGTKNILDYAVKCKAKRFIFCSSVEIYGENKGDTDAFKEDYCGYINCNTLRAGYPEGKRAGEALCKAYAEKFGIDIIIPRIARVYGPTMSNEDSKASAQFIRNAINDSDIVLKSMGNQYFSYVYAADAVTALLYLLDRAKTGEAYNVADKNSNIHLRDFAKIVADSVGRKVIFDLPDEVEKSGFSVVAYGVMDASKIEDLGWRAKYDINKGINNIMKIANKLS